MQEQFDELIDGFLSNRVGISPSFLPDTLIEKLQADLLGLHLEGYMKMAGVGNKLARVDAPDIRRDKIYWIDKKSKNINEQEFVDIVEQFISYLNRTCYTGINDYEFHYAIYEPGSFYKKHKDQFRNDSGRKFSLITYLNENWTPDDGGQLLVYHDDRTIDILPEAGKAVFFKSNETEHEVALSSRLRMSLTGWLKSV